MIRLGSMLVVFTMVAALCSLFLIGTNKRSNDPMKANAQDIHSILVENPNLILEQLEPEKVEISLLLDGKGGRVLVRVQAGEKGRIPESVMVNHRNRQLEIMLEATESFEDYLAQ